MQDRDIARSITEIFLASKIIKAVENVVARKESALLIDSDNILLEDYLFDSYENNYMDKPIFKNIMFVDSHGRVLNISGSLFVTEAETMELANGTIVRTPTVNMESTNEVASSFISMPSSVEITGTLSNVKDITIEKVGNNCNIVDTQTQEIIATVKTSVVPALKDFAASIVAAIKSLFGSIVNDPLPYAIGFLGGAILLPVLNKVIGFLRNRKQNNQNSQSASGENVGGESYFIDDIDQLVFEEANSNVLRRAFDKIMMILKTIYRKGVNFIKAVAGFMVGIFNRAKDLALKSLEVIKQLFIKTKNKTIQVILYIVDVIIRFTKFVAAKIQKASKAVYNKIKSIANTLKNSLQTAIQKIRYQFKKSEYEKEYDEDLQEYLELISRDLDRLYSSLDTIFSKDFVSDEGKRALSEAAEAAENTFKHIFSLLMALLAKLKNKAKEIALRLIDKTVKVLQVIGDVIYSFIKALGEFARRIKAKVREWIDKIKNTISTSPIYQKLSQQLSNIKERIR